MTDFAGVIAKYGKYVGAPDGRSMQPMLRSRRDAVVLVAPQFPLKKYDVILYRRSNGQYVLHRIISVRHGYVICGDRLWRKEYGITDENVIGVATGFFRDKKYVSCDNFRYRVYCRVWCALRPFRSLKFHVKLYAKALMRKLGWNGKEEKD